ncbi:SDR family NAD(P)-dependent oxidoreductase [Nakamurella sp. PAMC28650]|nr:SDR family NAD(P)-dependent oxidoreductase [Nakamurella sp. PAMC28650]
MPIDDVWVTGEPVPGIPGQRQALTDQHVVATTEGTTRNGAQTEHLPRNADQGSNGADMTPQNRNNGSSNGSENGGVSGIRPAMQSFDPRAFDPGPDLPPLPTLRPLPTIRPLNRWPAEPAPVRTLPETPALPQVHPVDEPAQPAEAAQTDEPAPPDGPAPPSEPATAPPTEPATTLPTEPVRHHRRASEVVESESDAEPVPSRQAHAGARSAQRVLVVGGSGVIGSAVARAMAGQGARVAVHHATRAAEAEVLVADLPGEGHLSLGADLADSEAVAELIRSVDEKFDGLDVVIDAASAGEAAAGASVVGSSLAEWTDAWTGALTVDVLGAATVAHAAASAFVARGAGGRIILLAAKGRPFTGSPNPVVSATEQAVEALGSALAAELAPHGIGVIVVGSGSGFVSGSGAAAAAGWSPAALAETVAWLASGPASALPGAIFNIAG